MISEARGNGLETHGTTTISYVDLVGTFSSSTLPATFAVDQIGAVDARTSGVPVAVVPQFLTVI